VSCQQNRHGKMEEEEEEVVDVGDIVMSRGWGKKKP
jgi:hypothetical protein